jgi:hypothetical protein
MSEVSTVYTEFNLENGQIVKVLLNDNEIQVQEADGTWWGTAPIKVNDGEWLSACFQSENGTWYIERVECDGDKISALAEALGLDGIGAFSRNISDLTGYVGQCINEARDQAGQ